MAAQIKCITGCAFEKVQQTLVNCGIFELTLVGERVPCWCRWIRCPERPGPRWRWGCCCTAQHSKVGSGACAFASERAASWSPRGRPRRRRSSQTEDRRETCTGFRNKTRLTLEPTAFGCELLPAFAHKCDCRSRHRGPCLPPGGRRSTAARRWFLSSSQPVSSNPTGIKNVAGPKWSCSLPPEPLGPRLVQQTVQGEEEREQEMWTCERENNSRF